MRSPERILSREPEHCKCGAFIGKLYVRTTTMRDYHVYTGCSKCCPEMRDDFAVARMARLIGQEMDAALCSFGGGHAQ